MSWYNPASWNWSGALGIGSGDPSNPYRKGVVGNAQNAESFAGDARANYNAGGVAIQQQRDYLQGLASGQNSVSAEQLRQGLQQNLAAQQSMAAGAAPQNAAMAARTAAIQQGRLGAGLAGQQALAGLQERNQANQALGELNLGARGQDLQGTLGGYSAANQGYGTALGTPQKTWGGAIGGAAAYAAQLAAKSDRTAKTEISGADAKAKAVLAGLKAYSYKYKDEADGKGEQFGVMAQDLEKAGLRGAVIDTPGGKYVHGGKAATASLALTAALARRVEKLEGKK